MNKILVGAFTCLILSLPLSAISATSAVAVPIVEWTMAKSQPVAAEHLNESFTSDSIQYVAAKARFQNCRQLNRVLRHGVGMVGARDRGFGKNGPVLNFARDSRTYRLNAHLDKDHDRISCERH